MAVERIYSDQEKRFDLKWAILLLFLILLHTPISIKDAYAGLGNSKSQTESDLEGGSSDGGAKGIACEMDGQEKVFLADTFALKENKVFKNLKIHEPTALVQMVAEFIDRKHPEKIFSHPLFPKQNVSAAWIFVHTFAQLSVEYGKDLPDLPDDHIDPTNLPKNCRKVQIAVQNLTSGIIQEDLGLVGKMGLLDRNFLQIHETFMSLRNRPGIDSTPIRKEVEALAKTMIDPELSTKGIILKIIGSDSPSVNDPQWSWKDMPLIKHCMMKLFSDMARRADVFDNDLERDTCLNFLHELDKNGKPASAPTTPTISNFPARLNCKVSHLGENFSGPEFSKSFSLIRTFGSGNPGEKDIYQLQSMGEPSIQSWDSSEQNFIIKMKDSMINAAIPFVFSVEFQMPKSRHTLLFIDQYFSYTDEFVGSVQSTPRGDDFTLDPNYASKVVCVARKSEDTPPHATREKTPMNGSLPKPLP